MDNRQPAGLDHRGLLWKLPDWDHDDPLPFNPSISLMFGTIIMSTLLCTAFQTVSEASHVYAKNYSSCQTQRLFPPLLLNNHCNTRIHAWNNFSFFVLQFGRNPPKWVNDEGFWLTVYISQPIWGVSQFLTTSAVVLRIYPSLEKL